MTSSEMGDRSGGPAAGMSLEVAKLIGDDPSAFVRLASELQRMHGSGVISGGKQSEGEGVGAPVAIDTAEARRLGISGQAIALAEELVALSNDLVASLSDDNPTISTDSVAGFGSSYPALSAFFEAASMRRVSDAEEVAAVETASEAQVQAFPVVSHIVCGYYPNPKPERAAEPLVWDVPDPAARLRSWGYHETPEAAGGGWTRPRTWNPAVCGVKTFRDHAYIRSDGRISEQKYTGSPDGEPNPEVWRSGPWPYPDWPAYVLWWHQTR